MSVDYAAGLSHYDDLGVCGLDEVLDDFKEVKQKVSLLAAWLRECRGSCVVHVGAGLSTSAGIPDFRGKSGVWTKLLRGEQKPTPDDAKVSKHEESDAPVKSSTIVPFDETKPTISHMLLRELCNQRKFLSELHGDFYLDECTKCRSRYIRQTAAQTMRLQRSTIKCPRASKPCTGFLRDTILDWESPIPHNELRIAQRESKAAKLHLCIGSTMQLRPAKDLVCNPRRSKEGKKLVIINLQPTENDKIADLVIHYYADDVMRLLAEELDLQVPAYDPEEDPTKQEALIGTKWEK